MRTLGLISVRSFDRNDARRLSVPNVRPPGPQRSTIHGLNHSATRLNNVRPLVLPDVRQLGLNRSATRLNDVRTLGLNRSTIRLIGIQQIGLDHSQAFAHSTKLMLAQSSSMTFGRLASNLLPRSFGHLRLNQFQHLFSRPFGLKRSANFILDVRAFVLAAVRSRAFGTSLVINVRPLALDLTCHSAARQPMCRAFTQSSRSTSHVAQYLLLDNTPTRALQQSAILMIGLLTFGTWALTIRHFGLPGDQPSALPNAQPFAHSVSFVQTFNLERSYFRHSASLTLGLSASTGRPIHLHEHSPMMTSQSHSVTVDGQQKTERSTGYTPSSSCSPKNTQNINRSTNPVHERSTGYTPMEHPVYPYSTLTLDKSFVRAFKQSDVRPQRCSPFGFNSSTIHVYEHSSSRPFGLKGVRPLVSTPRPSMCTSVQAVGRSASKVFALWFQPLDHPCVRAFKQSAVRPQRYSPFDFNRSTNHVYERSSSRPFGLKGIRPLISTARPSLCMSVQAADRSASFGFNRLTNHVYERSISRPFGLKGVHPLFSTARPSMCTSVQAVGRSASKVFALWFQPLDHPCRSSSRPFGLKGVRPLVSTARPSMSFKQPTVRPPFGFNRSTISVRAFKQSAVRLPFDVNRSTIPVYERSSIRPFDAINIVHSASMTFVRLASVIRPHMPLDFYRLWPHAFSSYVRLGSIIRPHMPLDLYVRGLKHSAPMTFGYTAPTARPSRRARSSTGYVH
ncbi:hypothetical protein LR48_Vigan07g167000 [Vigna angularis]|uniref:Uncharacterized protein n=1 Tax=Phaseolus angularis TaxID=3914 RepID=A0A0L9UZ60_PHAAN|nr:hypothetical protein LR48_Vigan07g167000 [Vigna angularis]